MTPIHALIFEKYVKMCVYVRQIKKPYKFIVLWRSTHAAKKVGWEVIFFKTRAHSVRARKPWQEFECSALNQFFQFVFRLNGL